MRIEDWISRINRRIESHAEAAKKWNIEALPSASLIECESDSISFLLPNVLSENAEKRWNAIRQISFILLPKLNLSESQRAFIIENFVDIDAALSYSKKVGKESYRLLRIAERHSSLMVPMIWRALGLLKFQKEMNYDILRNNTMMEVKNDSASTDNQDRKQ